MNVAYSASLGLNTDRGKSRKGENQGRVTSIGINYSDDYSKPTTTLSVSGTHGQNEAIIKALRAQKLTDLKVTHVEPGDRTADIMISVSDDPSKVVTALRQTDLISETDKWTAEQFVGRTKAAAETKQLIANWRDKNFPPKPDPEIEVQRIIRRAS